MSPQAAPAPAPAPVRVFISYAWEDDTYREWVAQLASQLREDGVDARLDRWHLQRGQTIPEFMNSEVRQADKVLVLCSPKYQEKVHAMEDGGASTGSGWESMLLSSAMFAQDARDKAVTALARGEWKTAAPSYLQGLPYDNLAQADNTELRQAYTSLLQRLMEMTEAAPPVGSCNIQAPNSAALLFGGRSLDPRATDRCALPPVVTLPTRHRMPYRSLGSRFAGRIKPLWDLHDLLHQDGTAVIEGVGVVIGAGGLGKTQLATEYVHRFGNYYPGGVFWTNADQGLATGVQQIAVGANIAIDGALPVEQQCEVLWQSLGQMSAPVLIVFDNFSETEALQPWLPVGTNLKALVTTRRRDLKYSKVPLAFLSQEEGLELLNSGERIFGPEAYPLIDALGGLPLALELACEFLNRGPTLDIDALLVEIAKLGELAALNVFTEHYKDELPTRHERAVGATFQLSWDLVSETGQQLLRLMGLWAPAPVPRRLLKRAMDDILDTSDISDSALTNPVDNGISELERLSLVELDEDYDPQIHRLLRGFVRAQTYVNDEEIKTQAVEAVETELSRTRTETDTAALTELEKVLPHGQMVLDTGIADPEQAIDIANSTRWHQGRRGRYQLAKAAGQHALALAQQSFEPGHSSIATNQSNLALVLQELGDLEGAKTLLTEALVSDQQSFEPGHPSIARSQSNLAQVLQDLGDLEGAKTLLTEALASAQHSFEPGHPSIAIKQSNLALVHQDLGDLEGAKTLLTEALASDQHSFESGHPSIARSQSNLAQVLQDLGDLEGAKILLTEALASDQHSFEPGHPSIARIQSNLALVLKDLSDLEGAKTLLTEALASAQQSFEPSHPKIATRQSNLALVLKDLGDFEGAKTLLTEALESAQQSFEPDHPSIAIRQSNLALVHQDLGDLEGAKTLLTEALASAQQSFEPGHPNIAIRQSNLATVLQDLGDLEGAKTLLIEALTSAQQGFEPGHPSIAIRQSNLALVFQDLGDLEGSKTLLIQSYEAFKNLLGKDHPNTLRVKGNLEAVESEIKNND